MEGTFENHLNGPLFYETLARILSKQYGVEITATVRPRGQRGNGQKEESA